MPWTENLRETIEKFDPEFLTGIRPASISDILELTTILRRTLPSGYDEFLKFMGNMDGGLLYSERISTVIGDIVSYCEDALEDDPEHSFDQCIPIAVGLDFEGFGVIPSPDAEWQRIVFLEDGQAGDLAFESLPAMCFSHAFMYEQCATGGWALIRAVPEPSDIDALSRRLAENGYIRQWFSKGNRLYFRHENKLITIVADRARPPAVYIGGREMSAIDAAISDVEGMIGNCHPEWNKRTTLAEARKYTLDAAGNEDDD
ncbi:hypothetical protein [Inquilinus limosus]|uniref:hypothetical protein n=1 Tax=Inquilinus limosus TaxID=171674 RepID=UPI001198272B|nr:hypothetical protein [Inquilinus limosus]